MSVLDALPWVDLRARHKLEVGKEAYEGWPWMASIWERPAGGHIWTFNEPLPTEVTIWASPDRSVYHIFASMPINKSWRCDALEATLLVMFFQRNPRITEMPDGSCAQD